MTEEQSLPYEHSSIVSRPPLTFPGGARLAVYVGLNIERFRPDLPVDPSGGPVPDPLAYGWRDYGSRVGIWRLMDVFDDLGIPVSGIINSDAARAYPEIVEAGVERQWAWVAHGQTNSTYLSGMSPDEEQEHLAQMCAVYDATLPARPTGWLGPGLTETHATPRLLADAGFTYLLDWCCDDQPFPLTVPGMQSVPYSLEVNDFVMFMRGPGLTGADYEQMALDQFEQLLADSARTGRVMALPLHTFIMGQPLRTKYLARVLRAIVGTPEVWFCTSDELAAHCAAPQG
ncbi:polysaccharide deacetylase family protein [Pseudonocardia sp. MH-G8]|uniref:polysaccharide deacetylase family protein n=1 Tax=Pseudonocardia sp. MH-G8 TaxID=1854588 RepID=UPI000BA076DC|nr:polysaccharide deacetylase family protein [Pseudonocardia sp. MH-G8]OZM78109.1 polysaccharide deacetylase [Pseudonocardia sp. MH-G8]